MRAFRGLARVLLCAGPDGPGTGAGLVVLRLCGALMAYHGWGKLTTFGEWSAKFPDPLHVGSPVSLGLATFAELFCALAVLAGFGTRLAAFFVAFTMFVAGFVVQAGAPFSDRELAIAYLVVFVALIFTGAGRFSLDRLLFAPRNGD